MYRDQFGQFVCGYWGLKGLITPRNTLTGVLHSQEGPPMLNRLKCRDQTNCDPLVIQVEDWT